jgi:hypothetical protein
VIQFAARYPLTRSFLLSPQQAKQAKTAMSYLSGRLIFVFAYVSWSTRRAHEGALPQPRPALRSRSRESSPPPPTFCHREGSQSRRSFLPSLPAPVCVHRGGRARGIITELCAPLNSNFVCVSVSVRKEAKK